LEMKYSVLALHILKDLKKPSEEIMHTITVIYCRYLPSHTGYPPDHPALLNGLNVNRLALWSLQRL